MTTIILLHPSPNIVDVDFAHMISMIWYFTNKFKQIQILSIHNYQRWNIDWLISFLAYNVFLVVYSSDGDSQDVKEKIIKARK